MGIEQPLPFSENSPLAPRSRNLPTPNKALVIAAHPDDAEFHCGATLAKWAANGCQVNYLVLTDGSKGTWDAGANIALLIETRRKEQANAARKIGATGKVIMLDHVDGELDATLHTRDQVAYWIRSIEPDVVLAHDPWKRYRLHPDHRNAGYLALDGIVAARDPHFFRHHDVSHHRPDAILLFEADEANHCEDVTGYVQTKIDALMEHRSQFHTTHQIEDDGTGAERFAERVTEHAADAGRPAGFTAGEQFRLLP